MTYFIIFVVYTLNFPFSYQVAKLGQCSEYSSFASSYSWLGVSSDIKQDRNI